MWLHFTSLLCISYPKMVCKNHFVTNRKHEPDSNSSQNLLNFLLLYTLPYLTLHYLNLLELIDPGPTVLQNQLFCPTYIVTIPHSIILSSILPYLAVPYWDIPYLAVPYRDIPYLAVPLLLILQRTWRLNQNGNLIRNINFNNSTSHLMFDDFILETTGRSFW